MRDPVPDRQAARAAGRHRVQTVTIWTAACSTLAAAMLAAVLANGTAAARQNTSGNQLQPPDTAPGIGSFGTGRPIVGSGGS